jgi:hypothetical protein
MYPTVVAFAILPSDLHAKSKPSRNVKSLHNARGLSAIHPQNHPLDFPRRLAKKATQTIPLVFISSADPGQLGIEIFGPNAENDPDRVSIPLFERSVRNGL